MPVGPGSARLPAQPASSSAARETGRGAGIAGGCVSPFAKASEAPSHPGGEGWGRGRPRSENARRRPYPLSLPSPLWGEGKSLDGDRVADRGGGDRGDGAVAAEQGYRAG